MEDGFNENRHHMSEKNKTKSEGFEVFLKEYRQQNQHQLTPYMAFKEARSQYQDLSPSAKEKYRLKLAQEKDNVMRKSKAKRTAPYVYPIPYTFFIQKDSEGGRHQVEEDDINLRDSQYILANSNPFLNTCLIDGNVNVELDNVKSLSIETSKDLNMTLQLSNVPITPPPPPKSKWRFW